MRGCHARGRLRKSGHDRDARDMDAFGGNAFVAHAERHFVGSGEIALHMLVHPHAVQVEIRDLHPHGARQLVLAQCPRQQLGGQKMRADDGVGPECGDLRHQRARVQALDAPAQTLYRTVLGRVMGGVVKVAPQRRRLVDQLDVEIRVQLAERGRHEIHHVQMAGRRRRRGAARVRRIRLDGLCRAHMAGTGRDAEDQNFFRCWLRHALLLHRKPLSGKQAQ
ncbi:hypothetical protein D3C81_406560 [compost metagenome]